MSDYLHTKKNLFVFFMHSVLFLHLQIGSRWKDVVSKCIKGHFQPLLLFYSNPDGSAITAADALRQNSSQSQVKGMMCSLLLFSHINSSDCASSLQGEAFIMAFKNLNVSDGTVEARRLELCK